MKLRATERIFCSVGRLRIDLDVCDSPPGDEANGRDFSERLEECTDLAIRYIRSKVPDEDSS